MKQNAVSFMTAPSENKLYSALKQTIKESIERLAPYVRNEFERLLRELDQFFFEGWKTVKLN